jgi:hypothetical protein
MGVITQKEYEESKRDVSPPVEVVIETIEEAHPEVKKSVEYFLLHPEVEIDAPKSFEHKVMIGEEEYLMKCVRNVVTTKEKILADFLLSKEYILIRKLEE